MEAIVFPSFTETNKLADKKGPVPKPSRHSHGYCVNIDIELVTIHTAKAFIRKMR